MAALLVRDHGSAVAARLGAAFAVGVAAYSVCSSHDFAVHATLWHLPIFALCFGNSVVFWLFACALFDDGFELRKWHAAIWAALVAIGSIEVFVLLPRRSSAAEVVGIALTLTSLTFAALAVGRSLGGWWADLVEGRRRLRVFVVVATAGYIAVISAAELILRAGPVPALATAANAAGLAGMSAAIAWSVLRSAGEDLFPGPSAAAGAPQTPVRGEPDARLLRELERLMTVERVYRQESLTIGSLSAKLGVPEYRLRRTINQGLGYRNFPAFLNHYRLEDAKAALADPAQSDVPVLTIAMDSGFQSLPPFNRAFKAETGLTPTEYRRRNLHETGS
jgi:AraC-like DNA-binding protein